MQKNILLYFFFFLATTTLAFAQKATIEGNVTDALTGEPLIGAIVKAGAAGEQVDIDGHYVLTLDAGTYELNVTYLGYKEQKLPVTVQAGQRMSLDIKLENDNKVMREVEVVADVARSRVTPVAFSTIQATTIKEELGNQDLPMVLNSTPGVYATQSGGGDGDARITIRGFNQRNVAIMIDGIPVNDMENGQVYWSNWSGLQNVLRSMQVQRGLGASKLALPSVGGTINVLTRGLEAKRGFSVQQNYSSGNVSQTTLSGTTGRMKGDWGITFTGSYKVGDGLVDGTWTKAWFYFVKVEKQLGKHIIGFSAVGAPQEHGQRSFKQFIAKYDKEYAANLGVDTSALVIGDVDTIALGDQNDISGLDTKNDAWDLGIYYNPHWGYLNRWTLSETGDTLFQGREKISSSTNYYHKPQFTLKDYWEINKKFSLSNILYMSLGNGGGVSSTGAPLQNDIETGVVNFQYLYNNQSYPNFWNGTDLRNSSTILRSDVNSHRWYGLLSTFDYNPSKEISISGGLDGRYYKGIHYSYMYDMLGGDSYLFNANVVNEPEISNVNEAYNVKGMKGDKMSRDYTSFVTWGGGFGQIEYKKNKISTFLNLTSSVTGYQRIDYYKGKDLVLGDTILAQVLTYLNDTVVYNGQTYTAASPEARVSTTEQKWIPGYTVKGGLNYNIDKHHNVFFNVGYLDKAPPFNNVFSRSNRIFPNVVHEKITAGEIGYGAKYKKFAANLNAYYTVWLNKPQTAPVLDDETGITTTYNIEGLRAWHRGVELDFAYEIIPQKLKLEGLASIGDWIWKTDSTANFVSETEAIPESQQFSANGVHVGDAAQIQYGASVRYEPIKKLFFMLRGTYFGKNYSDFTPEKLTGANKDREMWKMPNYTLFDLNMGYRFQFSKANFRLGVNIQNILDTKYISDASTRAGFATIDEQGNEHPDKIEVFFGQGRRFSTSLEINF
jgi:iron complex outermembrane receptor protein